MTRLNLAIRPTPQVPVDSFAATDDLLLTAPLFEVLLVPAVLVGLPSGLVLAVGAIIARPVAVGRTPVIGDVVALILDAVEFVVVAVGVGEAAAVDCRMGCANRC